LKYKIPISSENKKVILADGRSDEANLTQPVSVPMHGIPCDIKMIILNNNKKPILIGLDWLDKAKAIVDVGNKNLIDVEPYR
jgi:predicted aspartyl protease